MTVIFSAQKYSDNSELISACFELGYLRDDWLTLDPTYGKGTFWKGRKPKLLLLTSDKYTTNPDNNAYDFCNLPFPDSEDWDAVVYDPPYKLNGTPDYPDDRYGVGVSTRWQDRIDLMKRGQKECARVLKPGGYLLTKCMDQVVSGKVVWQTDIMTAQAQHDGLVKVDQLLYLTNPRPQPHSRQVHSRRNYSSLLIFRKN
jgi:hypothetical protein